MRLMTTHRVRHIPVVHHDQLYGIVSIGDIVKAHHDELELENYLMQSYIQGGGSAVSRHCSDKRWIVDQSHALMS